MTEVKWFETHYISFLYFSYLVLTTIILLELIFWIFPTADAFEVRSDATADNPLRYEANQDITHSLGWDFYNTTKNKQIIMALCLP